MPMLVPPRTARIALVVLAVAAGVNLAAGAVVSSRDPARAVDLWSMYEWCRAWLVEGRSLYTIADAVTDYPPNAIAMLSPIALLSSRWLVPVWIAGALALTPVLPWLVLRTASPRRDWAALAVPTLLFLCWAAPRTLLQFTLLSLTLAIVALRCADSRWLASGIALGAGLAKPHIAGPIAIWMLITGRIRPLLVAAAVVASGWAVYDARIGERPFTTLAAYWHVLGTEYAGPDALVGNSNVRGWTSLVSANAAIADGIWIAVAVALFAAVCLLIARHRSRPLDGGGIAAPAMLCLWSLLVTYHNGNNFILALPAFAFLWYDDSRRALGKWLPIAVLQGGMMYDVPVRWAGAAVPPAIGFAVAQFDRVLLLMTLAYVAAVWMRPTVTPTAAHAARSPR
jgi:hypothetical protein